MFEEAVSVVSIWTSMGSWLTPTVLFVVLNVMIGTIAVTSGFGRNHQYNKSHNKNHRHATHNLDSTDHHYHSTHNLDPTDQHQHSPIQPQLSRSHSALQRLKSINLDSFRLQQLNPSIAAATAVTTNRVEYTAPVEKINLNLDAHLGEFLSHEIENRNVEVHKEDQCGGQFDLKLEVEEQGEEEMAMGQTYSRIQMSRSKSVTMPSGGMNVEKLPKKIMKRSASDASAFNHFTQEEEEAVHLDEVDAKADYFINKFKQQLKLQRLAGE